MHAPVVQWLFDALPEAGVSVLRFNFRGVQGSEGVFDHGVAERLDVDAALDALRADHPGVPLWLTGWSFGADVALACDGADVAGWFVVAPPLAIVDPADMLAGRDARPTTLLCPEHDQFRSPAAAAEITDAWQATEVVAVPRADHFLAGARTAVTDAALRSLPTP